MLGHCIWNAIPAVKYLINQGNALRLILLPQNYGYLVLVNWASQSWKEEKFQQENEVKIAKEER